MNEANHKCPLCGSVLVDTGDRIGVAQSVTNAPIREPNKAYFRCKNCEYTENALYECKRYYSGIVVASVLLNVGKFLVILVAFG